MITMAQTPGEPVMPTAHDVELAERSSRLLARYLPKRPGDVTLRLVEDSQETDAVTVPASALKGSGHNRAFLYAKGSIAGWRRAS